MKARMLILGHKHTQEILKGKRTSFIQNAKNQFVIGTGFYLCEDFLIEDKKIRYEEDKKKGEEYSFSPALHMQERQSRAYIEITGVKAVKIKKPFPLAFKYSFKIVEKD